MFSHVVAISLSNSHSPLSLRKDDNLQMFLNEERKASTLTTDSCFVHHQYIPSLICT